MDLTKLTITSETHTQVADGKYTVVHDNGANLRALRYGQPWRDLVGDGLVLAMAQEIENLIGCLETELRKPVAFSIVPALNADPVYKLALDAASQGLAHRSYCENMEHFHTAYPEAPHSTLGEETYSLLCYLFNAEIAHNAED